MSVALHGKQAQEATVLTDSKDYKNPNPKIEPPKPTIKTKKLTPFKPWTQQNTGIETPKCTKTTLLGGFLVQCGGWLVIKSRYLVNP